MEMCGVPSVRQLLSGMTSSEVNELIDWARYPFGEKRADMRAGLQSAYALVPYRKKGSEQPDPMDFTLRFDGEESVDEDAVILKLAAMIPGARLINHRDEGDSDG